MSTRKSVLWKSYPSVADEWKTSGALLNGPSYPFYRCWSYRRSFTVLLIAEATWSKKVDWPMIWWCCYICWKDSEVHKRIQTSSDHAIYIHSSCHRLQLALIRVAASVKDIRMFLELWPTFGCCFITTQKKQRDWRASRLFLDFPSWRLWSLVTLGGYRMSVVLRQFERNCLLCCKLFHSYTSHLEMLRHMVYTPFG